ncbi:exonuclease DPD1, chloroplastic/mitochondrial [Silene latifolia]|uniref:exonuclease DPD1, chloroplastic/mitochondrial n=1 Tax=Silene latifolia TaxID=37657 RepID=UPI003D77E13F
MRTAPMCFMVFRVPGCKVYSWVNTWRNGFDNLNRSCKQGHTFRLISSSVCEQGASRRWTRRPITSISEGKSKKVSSTAANISRGITDEIVTPVTRNLPIKKTDDRNNQQIQCTDVCQSKAVNKDLAERATFIAFDLETTGVSRDRDRIIEIGLVDFEGGDKSTFNTLVNPGCTVDNFEIHKISTKMVCEPGVPRMEELIPILLQFVKSRQKPDAPVILVAHNARTFDVPFLKSEFDRCSFEIPSDWLFLDTLPISRRLWKSKGLKSTGMCSQGFLCKHYGIKVEGSAHRADSDASALKMLLHKLSFELNLSKADLWQETFTVDELKSKSTKKEKGAK